MIKKASPTVYILTGVKDNWTYTNKFMKCVYKQTYRNIIPVIVDDGSKDGTSQKLIRYYKKVVILKGDGGLWWTGCMHKGINYVLETASDNDYVLTINNDCIFPSTYIEKIVNEARSHPNSIVGSVSLDLKDKKTIIDSGDNFSWWRGKIGRANNGDRIDALTTRGTLFQICTIKKVGNFDLKHFPHYMSDTEYTHRAKIFGFNLISSSRCIIFNDSQKTGILGPKNFPINLSQLKNILFDRKSKSNIIDHFFFIMLCCPWYIQPLNYLYLIGKLFYIIAFLKPIYPFRAPIVNLRKLILES